LVLLHQEKLASLSRWFGHHVFAADGSKLNLPHELLQSGTMNKEVKSFFDSDSNDTIIKYYPSAAVKSEIKKQGYYLNYKSFDLRLIKYQIDNEKYICATILIEKIIIAIEEIKENWL
jgi:hypothetical protein